MNHNPFYHFLLRQNLLDNKPLYNGLSLIPLELKDLSVLFVLINRSITIEGLFNDLKNTVKVQIVIQALNRRDFSLTGLLNPNVYFLDCF